MYALLDCAMCHGWLASGKRGRVITYSDGSRYEGEYKRDKKSGYGVLYYVDGNRYEGGWKDGKKHGYGTKHYANGRSQAYLYSEGTRDPAYEADHPPLAEQTETCILL